MEFIPDLVDVGPGSNAQYHHNIDAFAIYDFARLVMVRIGTKTKLNETQKNFHCKSRSKVGILPKLVQRKLTRSRSSLF
jgi:hypothetical protein